MKKYKCIESFESIHIPFIKDKVYFDNYNIPLGLIPKFELYNIVDERRDKLKKLTSV
jgi:hypothetical protein